MLVNLDVLGSDVWGAACEAVDPKVAKLNWNRSNLTALNSALRYVSEVQDRYFAKYFEIPAKCPMASRSYFKGRGRIINRKGEMVVDDGGKVWRIPGVTSECHKVRTLAGFADHAFYKHGNTREEVAAIVQEAERMIESRIITNGIGLIDLSHFASPRLQQKIAHENTLTMRQRERARMNGRRIFLTH
jgi:hypothetical protein